MKGYDPTKSDVSMIAWNYLLEVFQMGNSKFGMDQAQRITKKFLGGASYTSALYKTMISQGIKPAIALRQSCSTDISEMVFLNTQKQDDYYPAYVQGDKVILCMDKIKNKIELKENLDRQLTYIYHKNKQPLKQTFNQNEQYLMKSLFQSCWKGYDNYMMDAKSQRESSFICSKHLFFRRSQKKMPIDRLFRYSTNMAERLGL